MSAENAGSKAGDKRAPARSAAERSKEWENVEREALNAFVGEQVLSNLGQPGDLVRVQVRPLWGCCYRVNILVGTDITSAKVGHSYFVVTDGDGNLLDTSPKVQRLPAPPHGCPADAARAGPLPGAPRNS